MRKITLWLVGGCVLAVILVYVLAFVPVPIKRALYEEDSPDGTMTAVYSYRPAGLVGWAQGDSYVYLEVYRSESKQHVLHHSGFADVPWEAVDRLHGHLPWPARRLSGRPGSL